jgi:sulfur-carrier protein
MPNIAFTPQLRRFLAVPEVDSSATTLRGALDDAFARNPRLRGYVLDDQGHLRANVVVFIDGRRCTDRVSLADPLAAGARVHVLQALSGG